jgi:transposase
MLRPGGDVDIPELTVEVARAAFPKGNLYLTMRDELGTIFEDEQFDDLFSDLGQPAISPLQLALITLMQFAENLTDRQAADSVRARAAVSSK